MKNVNYINKFCKNITLKNSLKNDIINKQQHFASQRTAKTIRRLIPPNNLREVTIKSLKSVNN